MVAVVAAAVAIVVVVQQTAGLHPKKQIVVITHQR